MNLPKPTGRAIRLVLTALTTLGLLLTASTTLAKEHVKTLRFAKGKVSTVVSNALIRGEVDSYVFTAKEGQRITLGIMSLEDNAVFEFFHMKKGKWQSLKAGKRAWYAKLPASSKGRYKVAVSGTRGNTSYELYVGISAIDH